MDKEPILNVSFPIRGKELPADHGYALYSAISQLKPDWHNVPDDHKWFGMEMISGIPSEKGMIRIATRGAFLRMRIPAGKFPDLITIAGKSLNVEGHIVSLGIPVARPVTPAPVLYARIVTFKNSMQVEKFLETARDAVAAKGIVAQLEIPKEEVGRHRRIITIKGKKIVGFSLIAHGLSDEDSLKLQSEGLGGRRAMGCGIFNPIRKPADFEGGNDAV